MRACVPTTRPTTCSRNSRGYSLSARRLKASRTLRSTNTSVRGSIRRDSIANRPCAKGTANHGLEIASAGHFYDFADQIRIRAARFLGRHGEFLATRQPRIRIRLDHEDLASIPQAHVDAAIVAQFAGAICPQRRLLETL